VVRRVGLREFLVSTDRISLPLGFDVPAGWQPVDPAAVGAPGAAFVAVRPGSDGGFTPNITLSVANRPDAASITDIADEAVARLGTTMAELDVLSRQEVGEPPEPGVAQVLRIVTPAGVELAQSQVHLVIAGKAGPVDRVVAELACTSTPDQAAAVTGDFQRFVAGFHVRSSQGDQQ
jgi:hypothetical protein